MANFYIVMNETTAWGAGQTREQAIREAAKWVVGQDGEQGISIEQMESLIESRHAVENGSGGFYLEPITVMEWDEKLVDVGAEGLVRLAWQQQESSDESTAITPIDLSSCHSIEQVVRLINDEFATDASSESVAASYAFDAAKDGGFGFGEREIEAPLDALVDAGANFEYSTARERALEIARSCDGDE